MRSTSSLVRWIGFAGALARLDRGMVARLAEPRPDRRLVTGIVLCLGVGAGSFGAAVGTWHGSDMTWLGAIKMPLLLLATAGASGLGNAMLGQLLGSGLRVRQTVACILAGMAIAAVLLGSLAPIVAFAVWQCPARGGDPDLAMRTYRVLLLGLVFLVGIAGLIGTLTLRRLLVRLVGDVRLVRRVLLAWVALGGLAGVQLSWMLSPFLSRPGRALTWVNPDSFTSNFFEYLWHTTTSGG